MLEKEIMEKLSKLMHPAINMDLVQLGIVAGAKIKDNKLIVEMAFPVLGIPIKDVLLESVRQALADTSLEIDFEIREMSEKEKNNFLGKEQSNWKGM